MVQYRKGRKSPWMVQVRDSSGALLTRSFSRKEDALSFELVESRKRQLLRAGLEAPKDKTLFLDWVKTFLQRRSKSMPVSSTNQDESRLRNYWVEKFGLRAITTITSAEIKAQLDHIQFELNHAPADRNRHRALLHKLFQDALLDDKVVFNPVAKIPLIAETGARRKSGTLEPRHQDDYVRALYGKGREFGMLAELMLWTGARIMSAAALQYRDFDFDADLIRIRRLVERATGRVVERTKGGGEDQSDVVPLFPRLKDAVLAHRKAAHYSRADDTVSCLSTGLPVAYESFYRAHNEVIEELEIPRFTPHALRKAFATNCKRAGYTRSEIREMLGHTSEAMTERYDLKDIEHLVEKGRRLGFGDQPKQSVSVSRLSAKQLKNNRTSRGKQ